ncbi:hypothetical protein NE237_002343 [Protea cynaroides]|uniref:ADP-ribosyl cyclase/cyclic ADP-ribose hydrolase n=1 Tax=Protea cynaroides TaxID=273540 RepID=A0A9Q0KV29_9MAGN|nr:hypothetical protein NE237_002343 [Protea cynaroides]
MAASSSSSPSFTNVSSPCEVFLNFRSEDTRNNFVGFLHKALVDRGIVVFLKGEEKKTGDAIDPSLRTVIEGCKIYIPIFSSGYAHCKQCLRELSLMVECQRSNHQLIIPIFFHVNLSGNPDGLKANPDEANPDGLMENPDEANLDGLTANPDGLMANTDEANPDGLTANPGGLTGNPDEANPDGLMANPDGLTANPYYFLTGWEQQWFVRPRPPGPQHPDHAINFIESRPSKNGGLHKQLVGKASFLL